MASAAEQARRISAHLGAPFERDADDALPETCLLRQLTTRPIRTRSCSLRWPQGRTVHRALAARLVPAASAVSPWAGAARSSRLVEIVTLWRGTVVEGGFKTTLQPRTYRLTRVAIL